MIPTVLIWSGLLAAVAGTGCIYLYATRDTGTRAAPRARQHKQRREVMPTDPPRTVLHAMHEPDMSARVMRRRGQPRKNGRQRSGLAGSVRSNLPAVAATVGAWIHARLPRPVAPRPHQPHHARLAAADAATLRWVQAVKPPSPHAGWLHLVTTAAVWRHLARQLEAQATSYQHDTAWFGAIGDDT